MQENVYITLPCTGEQGAYKNTYKCLLTCAKEIKGEGKTNKIGFRQGARGRPAEGREGWEMCRGDQEKVTVL